MVNTLDFEKVRAIYGMCRENYIGVKHPRFHLCMREIIYRENVKKIPKVKFYSEHISLQSSCVFQPTLVKRIPWIFLSRLFDNAVFYYYIGFRYTNPQYLIPKMRVRVRTLRPIVVGHHIEISVHIHQYAHPSFENCVASNCLILTSFDLPHYRRYDFNQGIHPVHVRLKTNTSATIPFVEIPFEILKMANLISLIDSFEVVIHTAMAISFCLEPLYE
jgi:hypothetical protein